MIRSTPLPRRPEVEERLANIYLSEVSSNRAKISCILGRYPAKFSDAGHVVDPGTGFLYEVGDCVYVSLSLLSYLLLLCHIFMLRFIYYIFLTS